MTGRKFWLCVLLVLGITFTSIIIVHAVTDNESNGNSVPIDENTKLIIFDTDMGADDA